MNTAATRGYHSSSKRKKGKKKIRSHYTFIPITILYISNIERWFFRPHFISRMHQNLWYMHVLICTAIFPFELSMWYCPDCIYQNVNYVLNRRVLILKLYVLYIYAHVLQKVHNELVSVFSARGFKISSVLQYSLICKAKTFANRASILLFRYEESYRCVWVRSKDPSWDRILSIADGGSGREDPNLIMQIRAASSAPGRWS